MKFAPIAREALVQPARAWPMLLRLEKKAELTVVQRRVPRAPSRNKQPVRSGSVGAEGIRTISAASSRQLTV